MVAKLLVTAGILSPSILDEVRKNTGTTVYLYNSKFIDTLKVAYENVKHSFLCLSELLNNLPEWDENAVRNAFEKSGDFTDFLRSIPQQMYLTLEREAYLVPIMMALNESNGRASVSGENTDGFARLLRTYPVHGAPSFPFPVGDHSVVHIDSGRTPENFPAIEGISHVILGFPILSENDLAKIKQRLIDTTPRVGKTEKEREAYVQAHKPVVTTAEQVIAVGGAIRLYL